MENPYQASDYDPVAEPQVQELIPHLNPFKSAWTRPRATVRWLLQNDPAYFVTALICLSGIQQTLSRHASGGSAEKFSLPTIIVLSLILGPLSGLFTVWVLGGLLKLTGNWLGGLAERSELRTALAWGSLASLVQLTFWVPELLIWGEGLFRNDVDYANIELLMAFGVLEIGVGLWGLIMLCNMIAEVQGYRSAWKAFGNLLLAGLVLAVPIIILVVLLVS